MIERWGTERLPELAAYGEAYFAENGLTRFSPERFCTTWTQLMTHMNGAAFVYHVEGDAVGAISGYLSTDVYTYRTQAHECFWYVRPDYRMTRAPFSLWRAFEVWATGNTVDEIIVGYMNGYHEKALSALFERSGYHKFETHWKKVITA